MSIVQNYLGARAAMFCLVALFSVACASSQPSSSNNAHLEQQQASHPPATTQTLPAPPFALADLHWLRVGMRPELDPNASDLPSTIDEINAFLDELGLESDCSEEGGWWQDEIGVLESVCGPEPIAFHGVEIELRFHLMRFELPGEDPIARLNWIEVIAYPYAKVQSNALTYLGPRPEWAQVMFDQAQDVYGVSLRRCTTDMRYDVWEQPDRYIVFVDSARDDRATALVHIAHDNPNRIAYGIPYPDDWTGREQPMLCL